MARIHDHTVYLSIGSNEIACELTFTVTPGFAGDRVDPPYPAQCEIRTAEVVVVEQAPFGQQPKASRADAPQWLIDVISNDPDIHSDMLHEAGADSDRADDIRDQLRDDALTSREMGRAA
ncbi:hypothetical protein AB4099_18840 [Bosea sp. 2KB_26]|uniref:hypothetical protein n=1 Tax=Bosea sp. 2KB_26 TaxID=3237475 RepID=UPI003F916736